MLEVRAQTLARRPQLLAEVQVQQMLGQLEQLATPVVSPQDLTVRQPQQMLAVVKAKKTATTQLLVVLAPDLLSFQLDPLSQRAPTAVRLQRHLVVLAG